MGGFGGHRPWTRAPEPRPRVLGPQAVGGLGIPGSRARDPDGPRPRVRDTGPGPRAHPGPWPLDDDVFLHQSGPQWHIYKHAYGATCRELQLRAFNMDNWSRELKLSHVF